MLHILVRVAFLFQKRIFSKLDLSISSFNNKKTCNFSKIHHWISTQFFWRRSAVAPQFFPSPIRTSRKWWPESALPYMIEIFLEGSLHVFYSFFNRATIDAAIFRQIIESVRWRRMDLISIIIFSTMNLWESNTSLKVPEKRLFIPDMVHWWTRRIFEVSQFFFDNCVLGEKSEDEFCFFFDSANIFEERIKKNVSQFWMGPSLIIFISTVIR